MFRFKYLLVTLSVAVLAGVIFVACDNDDDPDLRAEGLKAGQEMCDCVASYDAPVQPQHPSSPLPPANFDLTLDYTDPEILASLDGETLAYLMDPAIVAYFGELAVFSEEFEAYVMELYQCLGVTQKYQEYVTANPDNYDPEATDPLLSVFTFKNDDFKEGFKEGVKSCADSFNVLFALKQMQ